MSGGEWVLIEANRMRIEIMREREPGWSETLEETAAYLAQLGKTPLDYVEAWLAFRPSLEALRRSRWGSDAAGAAQAIPRLRPREPDRVFRDVPPIGGGRWFVG